ncbi:MAG: DUF6089 family protein [Bacteroidales bacterium]
MLKRSTKYGTIEKGARYSGNITGSPKGGGRSVLLIIIVIFLVHTIPAEGQRKSDIGFFTGIPWYMGDLSPEVPRYHLVPPAIGPIFRYNFNVRNAIRAHSLFYTLSGMDENFQGGVAEFESSFVDLGLDFEFNWWPYKSADRKTKYSPYVSAGLGYSLNYTGGSVSHLYIPFGGGVKANLGERLSGGLEVSMRKTFTDMIDGIGNMGGEQVQSPVGNNDWYFFTGLFLTYKVFNYRPECPTYD